MANKDIIVTGKGEDEVRISKSWLKTKKEAEAIRLMGHLDSDRVRKLWKIASGYSKPNYEEKPKH